MLPVPACRTLALVLSARAVLSVVAAAGVFGLSKRHITVSTVGVIPRIRSMAQDMPGVSLALSLHAPNQELRKQIVPSARAYPLHKLLKAIEDYQTTTQQRVFVEYVLLSGVNDAVEQAHELGQLLQGRDVVLNLIPWNPVYSPDIEFQAPAEGQVSAFQSVVREQYGVHCTVRQEKGQDISGVYELIWCCVWVGNRMTASASRCMCECCVCVPRVAQAPQRRCFAC